MPHVLASKYSRSAAQSAGGRGMVVMLMVAKLFFTHHSHGNAKGKGTVASLTADRCPPRRGVGGGVPCHCLLPPAPRGAGVRRGAAPRRRGPPHRPQSAFISELRGAARHMWTPRPHADATPGRAALRPVTRRAAFHPPGRAACLPPSCTFLLLLARGSDPDPDHDHDAILPLAAC